MLLLVEYDDEKNAVEKKKHIVYPLHLAFYTMSDRRVKIIKKNLKSLTFLFQTSDSSVPRHFLKIFFHGREDSACVVCFFLFFKKMHSTKKYV